MVKPNKSALSRIKITKNKKLLVRKKGQAHLNAKQSSGKRMSKRSNVSMIESKKNIQQFLYKR